MPLKLVQNVTLSMLEFVKFVRSCTTKQFLAKIQTTQSKGTDSDRIRLVIVLLQALM